MSERLEPAAQRVPQEPVDETDCGAHPRRVPRDDNAVERRRLARRCPHQSGHVGIAANDLVERHDRGWLDAIGNVREIAFDPRLSRLVAALSCGLAQHLEIGT
jgi:hypothetical protein